MHVCLVSLADRLQVSEKQLKTSCITKVGSGSILMFIFSDNNIIRTTGEKKWLTVLNCLH